MQTREETIYIAPGGNSQMNELDPMDSPVPGQSLTSDPGNMPYESPPDIVDPEQALSEIITVIEEPTTKKDIIALMASGFPVEAMVQSFALSGVAEGRFSADVAELIKPVLALYIIKIGLEEGIPVTPFTDKVMSEDMEEHVRLKETLENMEGVAPDRARQIKANIFRKDFEEMAGEERTKMDAREEIRRRSEEMPTVESNGSFLEMEEA